MTYRYPTRPAMSGPGPGPHILRTMSAADRFFLEFDDGLEAISETNMNPYVDPTPGLVDPDEAIIQARGRRRIPQTFSPSPDRVTNLQERSSSVTSSQVKEPVFRHLSRKKTFSRLTQHTKRSRLDFEEDVCRTEICLSLIGKDVTRKDEKVEIKPPEKKLKTTTKTFNNNDVLSANNPLKLAKALSRDQLLKLVSDLAAEDQGRLTSLLPRPDIRARVSSLTYHMHNLHRAVPATRLVRRAESHLAARTKVHWAVFRKVLSDDLGELVESGHWDTVTEYILAAWEVVTMTPVWEESVHNNTRNTCFRLTTSYQNRTRD